MAIILIRERARKALINDILEVRDILPDLKELNFSQFQEAVRQERKLEFLWEGLRWTDLAKNGELINAISEVKPTADPTIRNYYFPIPLIEMELNPNWSQNPGY